MNTRDSVSKTTSNRTAPVEQLARLTSGLHVHPINSPYTWTEAVTTESPGSMGSFLQELNLLGSSEMELLFLFLLDALLELRIKSPTHRESWNVLSMLRFFSESPPGLCKPSVEVLCPLLLESLMV